jgi:hypothetical protein
MRELPQDSMDNFIKGISNLDKQKIAPIDPAQVQGLAQIIFTGTGRINEYAAAMAKLNDVNVKFIANKEDLAAIFNGEKEKNGGYDTSGIDKATTIAMNTGTRGAMQTIDAYAKLDAAMEKTFENTQKIKDVDVVGWYQSEAKAIKQAADAQQEYNQFRGKMDSKAMTTASNDETSKQIEDFRGIFSRLKEEAPFQQLGEGMAPVLAGLQRIGQEELRTTTVSTAMANAFRLNDTELGVLANETGLTKESMVKMSTAMEKVNQDSQMQRAYMMGSRAAIGPLGSAFREVTMQIYWAALGFLFLTMTMTRAEQAELKAETNVNNMAKGYYNLDKLQKQVTKSLQEYGAGSEEAKDASANYMMAQKDLELQQHQLALTLKSEVLMGYQQTLSLIPLVVNGAYMLMTIFGSLKGVQSAYNVSVMQGASTQMAASVVNKAATGVKLTEAEATILSAVATKSNSGAKAVDTTVTIVNANAQSWLASALGISTFWANALTAALTLGIGVAISYGASMLMMQLASNEADAELKKMEAQAKATGQSFIDAGGNAESFALTLSGHSVDTSANKARIAISSLNNELRNLQLNSVPEIKTNIDTVALKNASGKLNGNLGSTNNNININFNGITVREDPDIDTIVNKVYNSLNKEYSAAGVKM